MHRNRRENERATMAELEPRTDGSLPSGRVRAFVALFLVAFVVCGLAGIEAWPLTGWRLFSQLRTNHQVTWRAAAVAGGDETSIRFADLPRAYRNFPLVMGTFASLDPDERASACRAWLRAARRELPPPRRCGSTASTGTCRIATVRGTARLRRRRSSSRATTAA
jgi:hypothetical protein